MSHVHSSFPRPARPLSLRPLLLLAVWVSLAPAAWGAQAQVWLEAETRFTDNVNFQPDDTARRDIIYLPGVSFSFADSGSVLDLSMNYQYRSRFFQRDTFPSDEILVGSTRLGANLVDGVYTARVSHTRTQVLQQLQVVNTPENQLELDELEVGNQLTLFADDRQRLSLDGAVSRVTGARPQDSSLRYNVAADFSRAVSPRQRIGASLQWLRVDFDETLLPAFDRTSMFLRSQRSGPAWDASLSLGYNVVDREGRPSTDGFAANGSFSWELSPRQRLSGSASRSITDQAIVGFVGIPTPGDDITAAEFDGAVFENTSFSLGYSYSRQRWRFNVNAQFAEQDFETNPDQTRLRVGVTTNYELTPRVGFLFTVSLQRFEVGATAGPVSTLADREDDLWRTSAGLQWELGARTQLRSEIGYETRSGSLPSFEQNFFSITLRRRIL